MNIAFIGPSCAGKSTQAQRLAGRVPVRHLSTGHVLRENRDQMTALGILARKYMERGELVPDEVINAMIEEAVRKTPPDTGLLFDGFPTTVFQARFLDELFQECGRKLDAVVFLHAPEKVLMARAACREPKRGDDAPEIFRNRMRVFRRNMATLLGYFIETARLTVVNAEAAVDSVDQVLVGTLQKLQEGVEVGLRPEDTQVLQSFIEGPVELLPPHKHLSLDLVVIGGPGSGKGTNSAFLAHELYLPHIAIGNLFRENLRQETELARIAKAYLDQGELVPDDITEAMVRQRLSQPDTSRGFILDGFPRTLPQVRTLDEIMSELMRSLDGVLFLQVPEAEIIQRIAGRRICGICQTTYHLSYNPPRQPDICDLDGGPLDRRDDDHPDTVRARLRIFHGQTMPVIDHYRQVGLLKEIDASNEPAVTRQRLLKAVRSVVRR
jgi:adenylate kinase